MFKLKGNQKRANNGRFSPNPVTPHRLSLARVSAHPTTAPNHGYWYDAHVATQSTGLTVGDDHIVMQGTPSEDGKTIVAMKRTGIKPTLAQETWEISFEHITLQGNARTEGVAEVSFSTLAGIPTPNDVLEETERRLADHIESEDDEDASNNFPWDRDTSRQIWNATKEAIETNESSVK